MKTAIYIEEGIVQLVLTPQNKFETNALKSLSEKPMEASIRMGNFSDCVAGHIREYTGGESLIIINRETPKETR